MPIVDKVMRDYHGRVVNSVEFPSFAIAKELQLHVMEIRPNAPFASPVAFEKTMQEAVQSIHEFLQRKYRASILGTGMHPLLKLDETRIWPHRHRQIYEAYSKIFNLRRHGWLNIQSYQLNLPYDREKSGVLLHNVLANICAYLPAIAASSPVCEGKFAANVDNRLFCYGENQIEVPTVAGDIVPEYADSVSQYVQNVVEGYSTDMAKHGADEILLHKDWVNSRGVIFRFDRRALEIRVMDEQECVRSDVALSCFVRSAARGLMERNTEFPSHQTLVRDYRSIVMHGLNAKVENLYGHSAREVCRNLLKVAFDNASEDEKQYLPLVQKRVDHGNLSEIIHRRIEKKAQKTDFGDAVISVYLELVKSLIDNEPYF